MEQRRYVSTDRDGKSQTAAGEVLFEVPRQGAPAAGAFPGVPSAGASAVVELRSVEGLLDDLGERIFVAEAVDGPAPEDGPVVRVAAARLVAETAWDDERAARLAVDHLIELGHERIGHISGPPTADTARRRRTGYRAALRNAGIPDRPAYSVEADYTPQGGASGVERLMAARRVPTAVFVANVASAIGRCRTSDPE